MSPNLNRAPGQRPDRGPVRQHPDHRHRQYDAASALVGTGAELGGGIDTRLTYIDLTDFAVDAAYCPDGRPHRTSGPYAAAGQIAGTDEGKGFPGFRQGRNPVFDTVSAQVAYRAWPAAARLAGAEGSGAAARGQPAVAADPGADPGAARAPRSAVPDRSTRRDHDRRRPAAAPCGGRDRRRRPVARAGGRLQQRLHPLRDDARGVHWPSATRRAAPCTDGGSCRRSCRRRRCWPRRCATGHRSSAARRRRC